VRGLPIVEKPFLISFGSGIHTPNESSVIPYFYGERVDELFWKSRAE
jgi:hypothetical protein